MFLDIPVATAVSTYDAPAYQPIVIHCNFTGYPQRIIWNKDGQRYNTDAINVTTPARVCYIMIYNRHGTQLFPNERNIADRMTSADPITTLFNTIQ